MDSSRFLRLNLPGYDDAADIIKLTEDFKWIDEFSEQVSGAINALNSELEKTNSKTAEIENAVNIINGSINSINTEINSMKAEHRIDIERLSLTISTNVENIGRNIVVLQDAVSQLTNKTTDIDERLKRVERTSASIKIMSFTTEPEKALMGSTTSFVLAWDVNITPMVTKINGNVVEGNSYTARDISADTEFTLSVIDENSNIDTATINVEFINEVLYGSSDVAEPSTAVITALESKALSEDISRTVRVNTGDGRYIYYAYPARLGYVRFYAGALEGGFEDPEIVSYTNSSGFTEDYRVYRSAQSVTGVTEVNVVKEV